MGNLLNTFRGEKSWCGFERANNCVKYRERHALAQTQELKNTTEVLRWIQLQKEYNKVSGVL